MKCELVELPVKGKPWKNLSFTIQKKDVKTIQDKEAICHMICALFHMHCMDAGLEVEELDEILKSFKAPAKIGFYVESDDEGTRLQVYTTRPPLRLAKMNDCG